MVLIADIVTELAFGREALSPRSGGKHKAWGGSPRNQLIIILQAHKGEGIKTGAEAPGKTVPKRS
jgi:hypothetical protein